MKIDKPGLYDIPMALYVADALCAVPTLSAGCAHDIETLSPAHGWKFHPRNPDHAKGDRSNVADTGTAAHAIVLEGSEACIELIDPEKYPARNGNIPDGYTNPAIRAARDQAHAEGKTPILKADIAPIRAMAEVCHEFISKSELADAFRAGSAEQTVIAQEGATWLRCRPDWLTDDGRFYVSFKTTPGRCQPASYIKFRLSSLGYDMAMAFYQRVITGATGIAPEARLLVQETKPPYACCVIGLSPALQSICELKVDRAIRTWERCMKSGRWPAYDTRTHFAEPSPWIAADAEERDILFTEKELEGGIPL